MGDEINMTISIPTDDDGYVLLQCEHCGTFFKGSLKSGKCNFGLSESKIQ